MRWNSIKEKIGTFPTVQCTSKYKVLDCDKISRLLQMIYCLSEGFSL